MAALEEHELFIRSFLSQREKSLEDLSDALMVAYPEQRGFSVRSIKRFCEDNGIRKRGIVSDERFDDAVKIALSEVLSHLFEEYIQKIVLFKLIDKTSKACSTT